jgi:hypothetical protein
MLRNREPALKIQFMLLRQLRQIWRAKELSAASVPRAEIAAAVGIAPFFLDDILIPAGRMSTAALKRSFMHLYKADRSLKSSRVDPDVQMLRLVRQLAEEAAPKTADPWLPCRDGQLAGTRHRPATAKPPDASGALASDSRSALRLGLLRGDREARNLTRGRARLDDAATAQAGDEFRRLLEQRIGLLGILGRDCGPQFLHGGAHCRLLAGIARLTLDSLPVLLLRRLYVRHWEGCESC